MLRRLLLRAVSVTTVALLVLAFPQIAYSAFTARTSQQLAVGTASLVAPDNLRGTYQCQTSGRTRQGITVTINGFDDDGPAGTTYEYRLTYQGAVLDTERTTSRSTTLGYRDTRGVDGPVTVRLTIRATLGNWTGPYLTRDLTC